MRLAAVKHVAYAHPFALRNMQSAQFAGKHLLLSRHGRVIICTTPLRRIPEARQDQPYRCDQQDQNEETKQTRGSIVTSGEQRIATQMVMDKRNRDRPSKKAFREPP